jgi:multidrug transporter EmrE-like cation transporter
MTDRSQGLALIGLLVFLSFAFQIQLKHFANEIAPQLAQGGIGFSDRLRGVISTAMNWRSVVIILLGGLLFVVWLLVLTKLELSVAMPLASIALVLNAVGGGLMIGEGISPLRAIGVLVVATGIGIVLKS